MHVGGRALERIGGRRPVVIGCIGVAISMVGFWQADVGTPVAGVLGLMMLQGAAWGLTMSPLVVGGLGEVPARVLGQASAVRSLAQQVGGAIGIAALTAVVTSGTTSHAAGADSWNTYSLAYVVAAGTSIAAACLALQLPNRPAHRTGGARSEEGTEGAVMAALE